MEILSEDMHFSTLENMPISEKSNLYQSLDRNSKSIRLCKLHAGGKLDVIGLTIYTEDLSNRPEYDALSYVWHPEHIGGRTWDNEKYYPNYPKVDCIFALARMSSDAAWMKIALEQNLGQALYSIRRPDADRFMWIDAICIDQSNTEERNYQVGLMGDILFGTSSCCLAWCSRGPEQRCDAMSKHRKLPFIW